MDAVLGEDELVTDAIQWRLLILGGRSWHPIWPRAAFPGMLASNAQLSPTTYRGPSQQAMQIDILCGWYGELVWAGRFT